MSEHTLDHAGLELVTEKSMAIVNKKSIVLPSMYRVVFSMLAKKNGVNIGAEGILSDEEISNEIYNHIVRIDTNAGSAIKAMEERDEDALKKVLEDTRKLREEVEALKRIAYEDGLTKALNRKWLEDNYLEGETETFKKDGILVLIDLNDFKMINDQMGHVIGDKVLLHLATRLRKLDANVVRYGGDEFIVIFDKSNSTAEVRDVINVIRELHLKKKFRVADHIVNIKFAYGITPFNADEYFGDVIHRADAEMYEDKAKIKERTAS